MRRIGCGGTEVRENLSVTPRSRLTAAAVAYGAATAYGSAIAARFRIPAEPLGVRSPRLGGAESHARFRCGDRDSVADGSGRRRRRPRLGFLCSACPSLLGHRVRVLPGHTGRTGHLAPQGLVCVDRDDRRRRSSPPRQPWPERRSDAARIGCTRTTISGVVAASIKAAAHDLTLRIGRAARCPIVWLPQVTRAVARPAGAWRSHSTDRGVAGLGSMSDRARPADFDLSWLRAGLGRGPGLSRCGPGS